MKHMVGTGPDEKMLIKHVSRLVILSDGAQVFEKMAFRVRAPEIDNSVHTQGPSLRKLRRQLTAMPFRQLHIALAFLVSVKVSASIPLEYNST